MRGLYLILAARQLNNVNNITDEDIMSNEGVIYFYHWWRKPLWTNCLVFCPYQLNEQMMPTQLGYSQP